MGLQQNTNLLLLENGGFQLPVGVSQPVSAPAGWSGRFWGRTGCNFDANGLGKCVTGDCGGVLECNGAGGAPPATLVQVVVGDGDPDQYDVSLVNGYNLPLQIAASGGTGSCGTAGCISNLNTKCPPALQVYMCLMPVATLHPLLGTLKPGDGYFAPKLRLGCIQLFKQTHSIPAEFSTRSLCSSNTTPYP